MKRSRGIVFVSLLVVIVVVTMLTVAFLARSRGTLFGAASYRDGVRAEQAARGGVNHLIAILENDRDFISDLEGKLEGATYGVTFNPGNPYFSVNNLSNPGVSTQTSCQGYKVTGHTADLVVVGRCGQSRRALRVVVQQGVTAGRSVAAVGRVRLSGRVEVDGVTAAGDRADIFKTPMELNPEGQAPGGILSKYRGLSGGPPAIEWTGGPSFTLGQLSRLETAPAESGGQGVSTNLVALYPDKIVDQGAADAIPDIDVAAMVLAGMSSPPLPGGSTVIGYVQVNDQRSVSGNLTVNGDLMLSQGTLYVNGDLTVNGGISGIGALYVAGDVTVNGGNAVIQTSQPSGAALFVGGDVTLQGIDAQGYLDSLAAGNAPLADAVTKLRQGLEEYAEAQDAPTMWWNSVKMAKHLEPWDHPNSQTPWVSPIPGPNGTFNTGRSNGLVPAVLVHLKSIPGYASDPRTVKLIRALEQVQYHFRHNRHNVRQGMRSLSGMQLALTNDYRLAAVDPTGALSLISIGDFDTEEFVLGGNHWDDEGLEDPTTWTHDRIRHDSRPEVHKARRDAFLRYNPLDLSWLGSSSFQGVVYARGSVHADTRFRILGSLISLGDVQLTNDTTLIFNQEYLSLFGNSLPLGIVHAEEI